LSARHQIHPEWYVRCVIYLVAFLHTRHRVTFRAAALILVCLSFLVSFFVGNVVDLANAIPETLTTAFHRLNIEDNFTIHPTCFHCHYLFDPAVDPDTFCPDCDHELFGSPFDEFDDDDIDVESSETPRTTKLKPQLVSPVQVLSAGLKEFFKRPGMVNAVNSWKTQSSVEGELTCIQDGNVWKEMKDANGASFFYGSDADEEIRLGVSFSLDWLHRFKRSKSSFAPSQSSGAMSFCIQNLKTSLK
ncbi:hypothetical protein R3P38DRAFT_2495736, partial [Favolaschia claudopus]